MNLLEILRLFLPLAGAVFGAFIGSYLATHWTEKRRIKQDHWGEIKNKVLSHLLDYIKYIIPKIENKVSRKHFPTLVNGKYHLIDKSESKIEDHKLYEISFKHHFSDLAENLDEFNENIEEYNEKYINLIQHEHEFLTKRVDPNYLDDALKIFVYRLLNVDIDKISNDLTPHINDEYTGALDQLIDETLEDRKKIESDLVSSIDKLSKEIVTQANEIKDDLEDLIKLPKLKGECKYCKIDLF